MASAIVHGIAIHSHLVFHLAARGTSLHACLGVMRHGRVQVKTGRLEGLLLITALCLRGVVKDEVDVVYGVDALCLGRTACRGCPRADSGGGQASSGAEKGPEANASLFWDDHVDEVESG